MKIEHNNEKRIIVNDINLAAALATMGVKPASVPFSKTVRGERDYFTFYFQPEDEKGEFKTKELVDAWFDDEFVTQLPEHPFSYIKQFNANRMTLLKIVKEAPTTAVVERNGRIALVGSDLDDKQRAEVLKRL